MENGNIITLDIHGASPQVAFLSDLHWDNPKAYLTLLKKHCDHCLENNIPIFLNGDTFCLMQGKGDRRGNKSDIRPEHNNAFYFDSIVDTAVEWFAPYAHLIFGVGYGNHETSIIKFHETDILKRWVDKMNMLYGSKIQLGGYGGWIVVRHHYRKTGNQFVTYKVKFFHGSGGGGIITRGEINLTRSLEMYEDFDLFVMGHIHENKATNVARDYLHWDTMNKTYKIKHKQIHMMITGTYKEEYGDGAKGWHVERGAPVKVLGGRVATFQTVRSIKDGKEETLKQIDSNKFPL